jgi:quercetin dioxygenase-like cupin family protein
MSSPFLSIGSVSAADPEKEAVAHLSSASLPVELLPIARTQPAMVSQNRSMTYPHLPAVVIARDNQPFAAGTPDSRVRFVGLGSHTTQDYGLFEYHLPSGATGARPHYHRGFSESFYILEGRVSVLSGDQRIVASAGDLVYVPRLGIHGFDNASEGQPARFLILSSRALRGKATSKASTSCARWAESRPSSRSMS